MKKLLFAFFLLVVCCSINISFAGNFFDTSILGTGTSAMSKGIRTLSLGYPAFSGSDSVACPSSQLASGVDLNATSLAAIGEVIGEANACSEIKKPSFLRFVRFTGPYCQLLMDCNKIKTRNDDLDIVKLSALRKFIAEDYASLALGKEIERMEKIEALRKFAEKKYKDGAKMVSACKSPFDYASKDKVMSNSCDVSIMDKGFNRTGENGKDYKSFSESLVSKPIGEDESVVQSFYKDRTDMLVNDSLANDSEMLQNFAEIISAKGDKDEKIRNIFSKLDEYKKQGKLDPVFGYDKDTDPIRKISKQSIHYDFFVSLMDKKLDLASAKKSIEEYRLGMAKLLLGNECRETSHFADICTKATTLYNADKIKVPRIDATEFIPEDKNDERFGFLKEMYPQGVTSLDDFKIVMDAQRCKNITFVEINALGMEDPIFEMSKLEPPRFSIFSPEGKLDGSYTFLEKKRPEGHGFLLAPSISLPHYSLLDEHLSIRPGPGLELDKINVSEKINSSFSSSSASVAVIAPATVFATAPAPASITAPSNSSFSNSFNNASHSYFDSGAAAQKTVNESMGQASNHFVTNASSEFNDNIAELNKKIISSEEKLEKIKAEKNAADTEKERQTKIAAENKTIADLKNQINDLKAEPKANIVEKEAHVDNAAAEIAAAALSSSSTKALKVETNVGPNPEVYNPQTPVNAQNIKAENAIPSSNTATVDNTSHSSGNRSPASTSVGNVGANYAKSGIVLTKTDGMTSEKVTETISAKIMEMGGVPFYIEEGGMVKEIIPVIKDGKIILDEKGKPLFEKIVKGKVGDKKFAIGGDQVKGDRSPANITNIADLKRDEEELLKRERAEYLKLKMITNKAFDKK